jgi:hypothetical protein
MLERRLLMTDSIPVNHVRYVKLGTKEDNWEKTCFEKGWIPLGYPEAIDIDKESSEEKKLKKIEAASKKSIRDFFNLGEDTVWVMFRGSKLYWGRAFKDINCFGIKEELEEYEKNIMQNIKDGKPKPYFLYRTIKDGWQCLPLKKENSIEFDIEKIDGVISKTASTQHSICRFDGGRNSKKIKNYISNLIHKNYQTSDKMSEKALIKSLSPTNFELFISNIYSQLGYLNLTQVGGSTQKDTDLILLSPEKTRLLIQIKTSANQDTFNRYAEIFKGEEEAYFIYHTGSISKIPGKTLKPLHIDELLNDVKPANRSLLLEWLKLKCYFGTVEGTET